jgi:4-hydroxy-tetrahydrodipicolinate synthase
VDGLLLVVPYYNKPPQEGMYQHFKAIAGNTNLPCIVYNIMGRTGVNMTDETTIRLSQIDNIVGTKEASGDMSQIARIIQGAGPDFRVWSGDDNQTFLIMSMGGYGVVSVVSHLVGNQIKHMMGLLLEGDIEGAATEHRRLLPIFLGMFTESNPIPVKYAVNHLGLNVGGPRLPLVPPSEKAVAQIEKLLDEFDMDLPVSA